MCTVRQTIMPTLNINITAGMAESFMPSIVIAPNICINEAMTLKTTKTAAQTESSNIETNTKAAISEMHRISARDQRNVIYCSQNMNGIPAN